MGKHNPKKKKKKQTEKSENNISKTVDSTGVTPPKRVSPTWMFLALLFMVTSVILVFYSYFIYGEISNYDYNLSNCTLELDRITVEMEQMEVKMEKMETDLEAAHFGKSGDSALLEKYIAQFIKAGLHKPIRDIRTDLVKKRELIPYDGKGLAKPLRFHDRRQIYIISPDLVFANFGSGDDIRGWLLLSYKVEDGAKISWKVLKSYCAYFDK